MILQQHLEIIVSYKLKAERDSHAGRCFGYTGKYLTIIPRAARMGSESIAHIMRPEAEWAIDSEAMRARGMIVLVKSN